MFQSSGYIANAKCPYIADTKNQGLGYGPGDMVIAHHPLASHSAKSSTHSVTPPHLHVPRIHRRRGLFLTADDSSVTGSWFTHKP